MALPDYRVFLEKRRNTAGLGLTFPNRTCLDRRRHAFVQLSFLEKKDERFNQKLEASVKDFARGVDREKYDEPFFSDADDALQAIVVRRALEGEALVYRVMVRLLDDIISREFVKQFMKKVSHSLKRELVWFAAVHDKPTSVSLESRHTHIFLAGRSRDGKLLRIARDFKLRGFRYLAEELATEVLGPLNDEEVIIMKERALMNAGRNAAYNRLPARGWAQRRKK